MKYFIIEPEVSGGLGPETVLDNSTHPPMVKKVEYKFEGWLGDPIIESFPVYLVTKELFGRFRDHQLSGYKSADVKISISDDLLESDPNISIPEFVWLQIFGREQVDDFFIGNDYRLVISDNAKSIIEQVGVKYWSVEDYK